MADRYQRVHLRFGFGAWEKGRPALPNVNVTYTEVQPAAWPLRAGGQTIEGDLTKLKRLVDSLVAGGYVTGMSSRRFEASHR